MERELEELKWLVARLPLISLYSERIVEKADGKRYLVFVGYTEKGMGIVRMYDRDAEIAIGICKYLEIPRKEQKNES